MVVKKFEGITKGNLGYPLMLIILSSEKCDIPWWAITFDLIWNLVHGWESRISLAGCFVPARYLILRWCLEVIWTFRRIEDILGFVPGQGMTEVEAAARQACSSQILYLSKSTNIATHTETAMLSSCGCWRNSWLLIIIIMTHHRIIIITLSYHHRIIIRTSSYPKVWSWNEYFINLSLSRLPLIVLKTCYYLIILSSYLSVILLSSDNLLIRTILEQVPK